jgi:hypothetical protein
LYEKESKGKRGNVNVAHTQNAGQIGSVVRTTTMHRQNNDETNIGRFCYADKISSVPFWGMYGRKNRNRN